MDGATYELRLRGPVSSHAVGVFEELDMQTDTVVSGVVQDQAALHGVLERIRDLGLELLDVRRVPSQRSAIGPLPSAQPSEGDDDACEDSQA